MGMRAKVGVIAALGIVAATLPFLREHDEAVLQLLSKAKIAVAPGDAIKLTGPPPLTGIELSFLDDRRDVVTAPAYGKRTAELTVDSTYQRAATGFMREGEVHEGAVVMTDIKTGRVIVWASYNQGRPYDICGKASYPSASVFKIPTGAALIEEGIPLNQKFCYRGGESRVTQSLLEPDEDLDNRCATLALAMGRSLNTIFARLAYRHLTPDKVDGAARRLGWDSDIPFDVPIDKSTLQIPEEIGLEFAQTAAGFWNTTLSPFQGANLAQTIANGGMMIRSFVVERVRDEKGAVIYQRAPDRVELKRAVAEKTAWSVARMMEQTVSNGSSFATFHDRSGRSYLPDMEVAGKTGTLAKQEDGGETLITWWVGFAPSNKPEVALSVLITNRGSWKVKASHVAADMLRLYFADQGRKGVNYPHNYRGPKRKLQGPPPVPQNEVVDKKKDDDDSDDKEPS
jgi:cell division protein FtsI/penicillin-binding protein 2